MTITPAVAAAFAAVAQPSSLRRNVREPRTTPWTPAEILAKLESSPVMVERSLLKLYHRQTADEQEGHTTIEDNGVGFNAFDADFLTSVAQQVERSTYPEGQRMSEKQRAVVRSKLRKYVGQLVRIANREA